jgi:hypothetical protein
MRRVGERFQMSSMLLTLTHGTIFVLFVGVAVSLGMLEGRAQSPTSAPKPWSPPKTPWGDPDLQGIYNYATLTPLERPAQFANKPLFSEEEAAAYEHQYLDRQADNALVTAGFDWWDPGTARLADRRTSLIVDPPNGRIPTLTPQAQAAARGRGRGNAAATDGPEDLGLNVRCLHYPTAGPPMMSGMYNVDVQFVQTKQYFVIVNEMIHDVRIVPLDGRPHGAVQQWFGDPRGHWEGATLVVETVNIRVPFRGSDDRLKLTERFTQTDANTIEYRFTVDDPTIWTQPWTAVLPMRRYDLGFFEYACHEGNERSMVNTLRTARMFDSQK